MERTPLAILAVLATAALLVGCVDSRAATPPPVDPPFEQHALTLGAGPLPTLVTGSFLGPAGAELAVLRRDADGAHRLRVHALGDDGWRLAGEARLRDELVFVDVLRGPAGDQLMTWGDGQLAVVDLAAGDERPLLALPASFRPLTEGGFSGAETLDPTHGAEIPRVDVTRDLDGDGLDDLVVPDLDGFWISAQRADGTFSEAVKLGPAEPMLDARGFDDPRTYREAGVNAVTAPWYLSRVHTLDHDGDGRRDLAFWDGDHLAVHRGRSSGGFEQTPVRFDPGVAFDADGTYTLLFGWEEPTAWSLLVYSGSYARTLLHSLRDVDGDGVTDLVTQRVSGRRMIAARSTFAVHAGRRTAGGLLAFAPEPTTTARAPDRGPAALQPVGYQSNRLVDLDGDGALDLGLGQVDMGVTGVYSATAGHAIRLKLAFFRNESGRFPERATTRRRVRPDHDDGEHPDDVFFPTVRLGDVTGDGRSDLVVGRDWRDLRVYPGVAGDTLFAEEGWSVEVDVPHDERRTWLADLDGDGRQEILLHHAPRGGSEEPHRVTALRAR